MKSRMNNLIIDISAVGRFKTGYYTYACFIVDQIYSGNLFPGQNIFLITSNKSCINEYILSRKIHQKNKAKIKTMLIPSLNPLLRILYCTLLISFLAVLIRKSTVFSPINYGPMFCFTRHYLFLHDLSVWGLPSDIQHRSKLTASVIQLCISTSSRFAFRILCQSNFTKDLLLTEFPKFQNKTSVLCLPYPSKISENCINSNTASTLSEINVIPKSILFVSSFYPLKNQMLLLKVAKLMTNFNFTLIGNPIHKEYYQICKEFADGLPNVKLITSCDDSQLTMMYKRSELYVQPSYFEGLSFTPLEASSYGCSLLLSDIGAHREFYSKYCLSYFDPSNLESLIESLVKISSDSFTKPPRFSVSSEIQFSASYHISKLNSFLTC